jgi:LacI family transcriptional regulator
MSSEQRNQGSIRLVDIAEALGMSVSTVSRALQDSHEVSSKTKKLVLDYAAENHYIPNPMAKGLKMGRSKTIGVVVSAISNNFFGQIINGIEAVAYEQGYNLVICQTLESPERELVFLQNLSSFLVEGLVISMSSPSQNIEYLKQLQQRGTTIVLLDRTSDELDTFKVRCDNFTGAYNATKHLINSGYTKIAHITSSEKLSVTIERRDGYLSALRDAGIPVRDEYICFCRQSGRDPDEVVSHIEKLLNLPDRPQAIFGASDRITMKSFETLKTLNIRIPEDIALLGFTNTEFTKIFDPSLTIVRQPAFDMGKKAIELIIESTQSPYPVTEFTTHAYNTELIVGNSTNRRIG